MRRLKKKKIQLNVYFSNSNIIKWLYWFEGKKMEGREIWNSIALSNITGKPMPPKCSSIEQRHFRDSNTLKIDKYTSYLEKKTKESQTDYPIFKGTNVEGSFNHVQHRRNPDGLLTRNAIRTAPGAVLGQAGGTQPSGQWAGAAATLGNSLAPTKWGLGGAREMKGLKGERTIRCHPQRGGGNS